MLTEINTICNQLVPIMSTTLYKILQKTLGLTIDKSLVDYLDKAIEAIRQSPTAFTSIPSISDRVYNMIKEIFQQCIEEYQGLDLHDGHNLENFLLDFEERLKPQSSIFEHLSLINKIRIMK